MEVKYRNNLCSNVRIKIKGEREEEKKRRREEKKMRREGREEEKRRRGVERND